MRLSSSISAVSVILRPPSYLCTTIHLTTVTAEATPPPISMDELVGQLGPSASAKGAQAVIARLRQHAASSADQRRRWMEIRQPLSDSTVPLRLTLGFRACIAADDAD
jgi:hypothetical protein